MEGKKVNIWPAKAGEQDISKIYRAILLLKD
ncbi:hypothetical protein MED121_11410 [Marinomonas sp. MED121]|nr:hypothetical protein MED121_11410 [Marinomonas sp. MED121]